MENRIETAKDLVLRYQEIFGKDNFYIELQYQKLAEQRNVNRILAGWPRNVERRYRYHVFIHFGTAGMLRRMMFCFVFKPADRRWGQSPEIATPEFYFKSQAEMSEALYNYPEPWQILFK